jgi:ribose transport system substrate-binding protein
MQYQYFQSMEKGTKEQITGDGYKYVLQDEKSDESQMVSGSETLITQGVQALVISPFKPDALGPIVQAAHAKKIPVVIDDIGGGGTQYDAIVISDNYKGGQLAADMMDQTLKARGAPKKVASITCQSDAVYAARRNVGFKDRIQQLGYTVVAELTGNSKAEEAYKVTQDILSKNPDVAGIFSCNDPMAVAATNAIADSGKVPNKDVNVIGFNADPEAITAIQAGKLTATIAQFPELMGQLSVRLAEMLINNQPLKFANASLKEVYAPVKVVTSDNATTYANGVTLG